MSALSGNDAIVQSQLLMAQAMGGLNEALNSTTTMQTSTRDVVATLTVPAAVTGITVGGVNTVGDGMAGLYTRVASDPGAVEKVQSADGSWFQLATPVVQAASVSSASAISTSTNVSAGTSISAGTTITAGGAISSGGMISAATSYRVGSTKVVGARIAGWGDPTGTVSRATFDTDDPFLSAADVAQRLAQLILDLKTHGLLGS